MDLGIFQMFSVFRHTKVIFFAFVGKLLKKYDILALQEHWLFKSQRPYLEKQFNYSAHSRAVDEDNLLPPPQKPWKRIWRRFVAIQEISQFQDEETTPGR